jgi:hypothetical protein
MKWERPSRTMNVGRKRRRKPPRKCGTAGVDRRREAKGPPMIDEFHPMKMRGRRSIASKLVPPSKLRGTIHTIRIRTEGGKTRNRPGTS